MREGGPADLPLKPNTRANIYRMGYTHIDESERRSIERAVEAKKSIQKIAKMLGRSVSSVSEEVSVNSVKGVYKADAAQKI